MNDPRISWKSKDGIHVELFASVCLQLLSSTDGRNFKPPHM